mgnify:CR=1 FL=1
MTKDVLKESTIEKIFKLAIENHQKNNLEVAEDLYNQVLKIDSNNIGAINNLGVLFKSLGDNQKAKDYYEKAIVINPSHTDSLNNLGGMLQKLGEDKKAKDCYEKVIAIDPGHVNAQNNLGSIFLKLTEYQKAKDCYEKAVEIDPNHADALNNLGTVFIKLGEYQKAKDCYEKAVEIDPNFTDAFNNLGVMAQDLGEYQKAKIFYEKAIIINPNYINSLNNLGVLHQVLGDYDKSEIFLKRVLKINPNLFDTQKNSAVNAVYKLDNFEKAINESNKALKIYHHNSKFANQSVNLFRLKHDVEQAKYLAQSGGFWKFFKSKTYKINGIDEFQKIGDEILSRKDNKDNKEHKEILLTPDEVDALLPFYKSDYTYQTKTISGSCINPNKNWLEVEDEYLNSEKQIMYIDNFLSDEALIELREFCLVSKVWNKEYQNKYLGAFSDAGFISPLQLQIAVDLKKKLPKLFGPHRVGKFWGFKYDATLGGGINIHADFAIHNLNFWITPDEFNNNKNSGGLKVYDAPAPEHWTFKDYNQDNRKIYEFLEKNNAKCTNIPYKFNRAVLFNSAYFHKTDEIDFKDEYKGRRINNTYLFGSRLVKDSN